jgi:DNA-binding transcriptional regulator YdaS (Cro superfamily)
MGLKEYMLRKNINIKELADLVGCSRTYMGQIIAEKKKPARRVIKEIVDATKGKVTVEEILNPPIWTDPDEEDEKIA